MLNSNIFMFQNMKFNLKLLDVSIPQKAFASVGGDGWNIEVGRDIVNWGAGETGNLVISDNFPYYDMIRARTYSQKYKYSYLLTFFPYKGNYYDGNAIDNGVAPGSTVAAMDGIYLYSAHRFEGRLFRDKLTLALTEAITYEDDEGQIQFAALSPMYFMHNAFIPSNSNSTLSLEANWATPVKGLNVYGEFLVDQGSFPGLEGDKGKNGFKIGSPDAIAALFGTKYVAGAGKGIFKANTEFAYVSPFTYLRDSGEGNWGLDYVAAIRARMYAYEDSVLPGTLHGGDMAYDEFVIGYKYGPDCLTGQIKLNYEIGKFDFSLKAFGMLHGAHDIYSKWQKVSDTITEEEYKAEFGLLSVYDRENYRYGDSETNKKDALWTTIDIGTGVSYNITKDINVFANFDAVIMKNIFNRKGLNAFDAQCIIGGSIKLF